MDLNEYQRLANKTDQRPGADEDALVFPLMGLASEVGSLVNQFKKRVRDGQAHELFSDRAAEELGDVLWYISNVSAKLGLPLEEVASLNLKRINERWPTDTTEQPSLLLDDRYEENEQLPRSAVVSFIEMEKGGHPLLRLEWNGQEIGNPLSDMSWDEDFYRYHDAFHLTYAALLGWSPISRSMFGRQRESAPRVREVEDSGRAKVVEEAIAALCFEYARRENHLDGVDHLDFSMLRMIIDMVERYEVRVRTTREWERAIIRSFDMWRALRTEGGGKLILDLRARSIDFSSH